MIKYVALDFDNKPINRNGKVFRYTLKGWIRHYNRQMPAYLKKCGFESVGCVVPTDISGRDYEYVRVSYGKK